jgi:low affinity Fe/Cu permease
MESVPMNDLFNRFSRWAADVTGSAWAFLLAASTILLWIVSGPIFGWSDTWQLVINTGTTIVTFLMVFLIQNTQNRDAKAMHLKLDELIRSTSGARNSLMDLERLNDEQLVRLQKEFDRICSEGDESQHAVEEIHRQVRKESEKRANRASSQRDRKPTQRPATG